MTLQERLRASARELIHLLDEAKKEQDAVVQERDARLLSTFESDGQPMSITLLVAAPYDTSIVARQERRKQIEEAFRNAMDQLGIQPQMIALDNGKAFKVPAPTPDEAPDQAVRHARLLCLASDSDPAREALCEQIEAATAGLKDLLLQYESSLQTSCKAGEISDTRSKNLLFSIDAVVAFELFEDRSVDHVSRIASLLNTMYHQTFWG